MQTNQSNEEQLESMIPTNGAFCQCAGNCGLRGCTDLQELLEKVETASKLKEPDEPGLPRKTGSA